jgi:hypothetical protein
MPNRNSETHTRRFRCAWAGMMAWSRITAMAMPMLIPATANMVAALKLSVDGFISHCPLFVMSADSDLTPECHRCSGSYLRQESRQTAVRGVSRGHRAITMLESSLQRTMRQLATAGEGTRPDRRTIRERGSSGGLEHQLVRASKSNQLPPAQPPKRS